MKIRNATTEIEMDDGNNGCFENGLIRVGRGFLIICYGRKDIYQYIGALLNSV